MDRLENNLEKLIKRFMKEDIKNFNCYNDIINFLLINNDNLKNIKNKKFNIKNGNDFYYKINRIELNKFVSFLIGQIYGKYIFNNISLFNYDLNMLDDINTKLNNEGLYICNDIIPENICDIILNKINMKTFITISGKKIENLDIFNLDAGTHWINDHKDVITVEEVQKLALDPFFLNVAQNYLEAKPILCQTNFWASKVGKDDKTHKFHQDYDDIRFLKVFIYLNDVDENNGAHTYVKESINNMIHTPDYKATKRIDEKIINNKYGDKVINICGKKGSIIFEDTYGFHKGSVLNTGHRFMLQFQYCCSTKFFDTGINFINNIDKNKNEILYNFKTYYPDSAILYNFN